MRGRALVACLAALLAGGAAAEITGASYDMPTARYPHGALGDEIEWGRLVVETRSEGTIGDAEAPLARGHVARTYEFVLPETMVFEDSEPRLWDVTGDGTPEVVVVQSHQDAGARLVILGLVDGRPDFYAATDFIGQTNRWLAPVGAADLDGDGRVEIAYVDRPHLARTLRVVEMRQTDEGWTLADEAAAPGHTNHRFGEDFIQGGIFDCGQGPEILTADAEWRRVLATRLEGRALISRDIGPYTGPDSLEGCQ